VGRNPQHRSLFDCCLSHFYISVSTSSSSAKPLPPSCEPLYVTNTSHCKHRKKFFINLLCIESVCTQKTHNRTLLFGVTPLKHGRHSDYGNQPLNIRMRVCYLDCHEAEMCCYLVIHIENLLHPFSCFTSICDLFNDSLVCLNFELKFLEFSAELCMHFSFVHGCHILYPSHPCNLWRRLQIMQLPNTQLSSTSCFFVHLVAPCVGRL
jgi:hypothetical protein